MLRWAMVAVMVLAGCDRVLGFDTVPAPGLDALACTTSVAPGDFSNHTQLFAFAVSPSLTGDQHLMYVANGGAMEYAVNGAAWSALMPVDSLNDSAEHDDRASLSYDGRHIFFTRHPSGGVGVYDLPFEATRSDTGTQTWGPVTAVSFPSVLAGNDVTFGIPSADGRLVDVSHGFVSHYHLTELELVGGAWTLTSNTDGLYRAGDDVSDTNAQLSPDGCWMVFARIDHAVEPGHEIMIATRGLDGTFGAPVQLFTNVSTQDEQHPWLSPDGNTLYYFDGIDTTVYVATRAL